MPWDKSNPLYRWKQKQKLNKQKSPKRHRVKTLAKRRKRSWRSRVSRPFRRRNTKTNIPVAPVIGLATTILGNELVPNLMAGNATESFKWLRYNLTGVDGAGNFDAGALLKNWLPTIVGVGVHLTIGRKVNPILARNKVPYLRV